jgi:hemolysin activation/secretion protein
MRRYHPRLAAAVLACALSASVAAVAQPPAPPSRQAPAAVVKGIVVVPHANDLIVAGVPEPAGQIDIARVPALNDPVLIAELRRYLGLPISAPLLGSLRTAISKYYAGIHRPFVSVTAPKQDVTDGVIQVVVVEARLGKINVENNDWFDRGQYLDSFRLQPGGPIDSATLQADLDWLNRNPYRHAEAVAAPGETFGTTDLTLRAQDRLPLSVTSGVDNTGNHATGLYRLNAGFDWGNALWRGDDFNYRFTRSPDGHRLLQHAFAYTAYLPWRDTLSLSYNIADTNSPSPGSPITTEGQSEVLSLRYTRPLPALWGLTQTASLGYDFKSTNNNILFGGISVFPSLTEIHQLVASYDAQESDRLGTTSLDLGVTGSPGGIGRLNSDAAFQTQQFGATARYVYGRTIVDRLTALPFGLSWDVRGMLQISGARLLPSEQMAFGGPQSNRAYISYVLTRDNGAQFSTELRAPAITGILSRFLGLGDQADQLVAFLFFDDGVGWTHAAAGSSTFIRMASIGPGISYQFSRYATVSFTYGTPLRRVSQSGDVLRPQFAVQLTF